MYIRDYLLCLKFESVEMDPALSIYRFMRYEFVHISLVKSTA
jgi:hypothetical protein